MKKLFLIQAIVFLSVIEITAQKTESITIDIGSIDLTDPVNKPNMLGVIAGPLPDYRSAAPNLTTRFQDIGVTTIRNNDYNDDRLDMERMFFCGSYPIKSTTPNYPKWDCDPNDTKYYHFTESDELFQSWIDGKFLPFFRLGGENNCNVRNHDYKGPRSNEEANWLQAGLKVVNRYNSFNGGNNTLQGYLDIWTEFPQYNFWDRDSVSFNKFWCTNFDSLKTHFPSLKIGGPGFNTSVSTALGNSIKGAVNIHIDLFLRELKLRNLRPDWIGFHVFSNTIDDFYKTSVAFRKLLRAEAPFNSYSSVWGSGDLSFFHGTELICDAWGFDNDRSLPVSTQDSLYNKQRGAAHHVGAFIALQQADIERAYTYRGGESSSDTTLAIMGLFYGNTNGGYKPAAYGFKLCSKMQTIYNKKLISPVYASASGGSKIWTLAGEDLNGNKAILISNPTANTINLSLTLNGANLPTSSYPSVNQYTITDTNNGQTSSSWKSGAFVLPPYTSHLITMSNVFSVSTNSLTMAAPANSTNKFEITSGISWTVTSDQSWLTLSNVSGSGNATITLTATANPTTAKRNATVTVSGTGVTSQTIAVTQDGTSPVLTVSEKTLTIAAPANSTRTFDISSNTSWTMASNQTWLTINSGSGSGNATITLTATENPTTTTRTAIITVSGTGVTSQTIAVTQDGTSPVLTVSVQTLTIAAPANSTRTFDISSNTSWTVASNQTWLTVSNGSGSGNATITLTATANPTTAKRNATVTISGTGVTTQTIAVTQDGTSSVLTVSVKTLTIAAPANSTKTFEISSNTRWTVASNQTWLTVNSGSGSGNATITLTATENPTTAMRTATITVSGTGVITQTIAVTQDGTSPVLTVSVKTLTIAAPANSTKTFDISSNTSWTMASNQTWLTINSGSGSGNATITITATENPTAATRTATLTVSGTGVTTQTIAVTQDGISPVMTVSVKTLTIAAPANSTRTFEISSNTSWKVASNQTWLTINSGSGSGNATITLTATENPTTATRTATVKVTGTDITAISINVTQDAGTTGIANLLKRDYLIYPNPACNILYLSSEIDKVLIFIYDINGKLVINNQISENKINISNLLYGVYTIKIIDKNRITIKKFVKKQ